MNVFIKIFRIIIGIGLAYGLIHITLRSTGGNIWYEIFRARKPVLLLTLLFYGGASISLPVYRWHLLLKVQGLHLRIWDLIRLTLIGNFFNMALPGAVSGDLVKMIYVAKHTEKKRAEAVLTVILDRALGLIGLLVLAAIMVLFYLPFLLELKQEYRPIQIAALMVCVASICGVLGLALLWFRHTIQRYLGLGRLVNVIKGKLPKSIIHSFTRLMTAFDLYHHNLKAITMGMVLSVLIHASLAIILVLIGVSIGEEGLRIGDYFLATQVSSAIAIIPLTPGGIGMRDATVALFFSALHRTSEKVGVMPVIMTLMTVFLQLIGGGVFMFSRFSRNAVHDAVTEGLPDSSG